MDSIQIDAGFDEQSLMKEGKSELAGKTNWIEKMQKGNCSNNKLENISKHFSYLLTKMIRHRVCEVKSNNKRHGRNTSISHLMSGSKGTWTQTSVLKSNVTGFAGRRGKRLSSDQLSGWYRVNLNTCLIWVISNLFKYGEGRSNFFGSRSYQSLDSIM